MPLCQGVAVNAVAPSIQRLDVCSQVASLQKLNPLKNCSPLNCVSCGFFPIELEISIYSDTNSARTLLLGVFFLITGASGSRTGHQQPSDGQPVSGSNCVGPRLPGSHPGFPVASLLRAVLKRTRFVHVCT